MVIVKKRGYLVSLYGGQEAYVETLKDMRLLIEAKLEAPLYLEEEGRTASVYDILENAASTIAFTEVRCLDSAESIEFSIGEKNIKDFFNFEVRTSGDNVSLKVIEKKERKKNKSQP